MNEDVLEQKENPEAEDSIFVVVRLNGFTLRLADGTYGKPGLILGHISRRDRALVVALLREAIKEIDPDGEA